MDPKRSDLIRTWSAPIPRGRFRWPSPALAAIKDAARGPKSGSSDGLSRGADLSRTAPAVGAARSPVRERGEPGPGAEGAQAAAEVGRAAGGEWRVMGRGGADSIDWSGAGRSSLPAPVSDPRVQAPTNV
ncbi:hypothetical protein GCM10023224_02110 [Streptomonospora halophila]|uniref:Uncharacterized protein n=1 Tax=Streptomonospora halophila TaxID=427369 RepID=A0ABP9GBQ9_9ACTN